jgi:hypothetical protein
MLANTATCNQCNRVLPLADLFDVSLDDDELEYQCRDCRRAFYANDPAPTPEELIENILINDPFYAPIND